MSLTSDRAAIAAALSTVDGVTGYTRGPNALKDGDGWPVFGGLGEPRNAPGAGPIEATWLAVVVLPNDLDAALAAFESMAADLWVALQPLGYVRSIELAPVVDANSVTRNTIQATFIQELS